MQTFGMQICIIFSIVRIGQIFIYIFSENYKNNAKLHTKTPKMYDIIFSYKAIIPKTSYRRYDYDKICKI